MNKPTLLIATPYYPPAGGGLERYARNIALRLQQEHGWRVVVVTSGNRKGPDEIRMDGRIKVYRLGYKHKLSNSPFDFGWRRKIKRIIKRPRAHRCAYASARHVRPLFFAGS